MSESITKGDKKFVQLLEAWVKAGKPVNLIVGKFHYQCLQPSDDEVVFVPQEGFENYASRTNVPGSG